MALNPITLLLNRSFREKIAAGAKKAGAAVVSFAKASLKAYASLMRKGLGFLGKLWAGIKKGFSGLVGKAKTWGAGLVKGFHSGAKATWNAVKGFFGGIWGALKKGFGGLAGKALQWGKDMIKKFADGVRKAGEALKKAGGWVWGKLKGLFGFDTRANDEAALQWGKDMVEYFSRGAQQAANSLTLPTPTMLGASTTGLMALPKTTTAVSNHTYNISVSIDGTGYARQDGETLAREIIRQLRRVQGANTYPRL